MSWCGVALKIRTRGGLLFGEFLTKRRDLDKWCGSGDSSTPKALAPCAAGVAVACPRQVDDPFSDCWYIALFGHGLVDDLGHELGPHPMILGYHPHLFDEGIVKQSLLNFCPKGEGRLVGDNPHGNLVWTIFIVSSLNNISLEGDFRPMLCGNLLMFLNCVAQAKLVTIDFEESGGAFLAEHVTDDSDEGAIWLLDGGGLINNANLILPSEVQQSRKSIRLGVNVSKIPQRPGKPT